MMSAAAVSALLSKREAADHDEDEVPQGPKGHFVSLSASEPYRSTNSFSIGPPAIRTIPTRTPTVSATRQAPRPQTMPAAAATHTVAAVVTHEPCAVLTLNDHASADKADAGDNALDNPAGRLKLVTTAPRLQNRHDERRSS